jgi:hypothetical protein
MTAGTIPERDRVNHSWDNCEELFIPTTAKAEGRDSIPLLTISAIMSRDTN